MFAGCGSPWKNACRKIIVIHASVIVYASSRRSSADHDARSRSRTWVPSRRSSVSRRFVVYATRHAGRRSGRHRRSSGGTSRRCAPPAGSRAPAGSTAPNSSTSSSASMKSSCRTRSRTTRAADAISFRSDSICRGADGRCTLTTTSSPFGSVARCTCPIDAAAIGVALELDERPARSRARAPPGRRARRPRSGTATRRPGACEARR